MHNLPALENSKEDFAASTTGDSGDASFFPAQGLLQGPPIWQHLECRPSSCTQQRLAGSVSPPRLTACY